MCYVSLGNTVSKNLDYGELYFKRSIMSISLPCTYTDTMIEEYVD